MAVTLGDNLVPGTVCVFSATALDIVPDGTNKPASLPHNSATIDSNC